MRQAITTRTAAHRRLALGAALLAVLVVAAGCGGSDEPPATDATAPQGTSAAGVGGLGGAAASEAPDVDAPGVGVPGGGAQENTGEQGGGSDYPGNAQAYAEAVLAAWHGGNLSRLGDLTTPQVQDQILQIPGPPSSDWTRIQCDGGDCMFYNGDGDYLLLHVQLSKFGQPHAANHVTFDATAYPANDLDYLKAFVSAWQQGNVARMHRLALPEVVQVFQQRPAGQVTHYGQAGGGAGLSIVVVTTTGAEIETHIGTTLLGGPQAIRKAVPEV